jgi:hypothetical protein
MLFTYFKDIKDIIEAGQMDDTVGRLGNPYSTCMGQDRIGIAYLYLLLERGLLDGPAYDNRRGNLVKEL